MLTVPEQFLAKAQELGSRLALLHKPGNEYVGLSYQEIAEKVQLVARALIHLGIEPQDRVAILAENRPEWVMMDLGSLLAGAVNVPIQTSFSAHQITEILARSTSRLLFVSTSDLLQKVSPALDRLPELRTIVCLQDDTPPPPSPLTIIRWQDFLKMGLTPAPLPSISPESVCSLIFTSGTTGDPKGVMLSHRNYLSNVEAALQAVPMQSTDTLLSVLPLAHSFERTAGYYAPIIGAGATVAYAKSLKEIALNLQEIKPTILLCVPRLYDNLQDRIKQELQQRGKITQGIFRWSLRQKSGSLTHWLADFLFFKKIRRKLGGRLRFLISGGAPLNPEVAYFFQSLGIPIYEGYGLSETGPVVSVNRQRQAKIGTVGPPLSDVEVRIVEDGEIWVRGPNVMSGYWHNPEATQEVLDSEGWFHTGDLGSIDDQGYLSIIGRKKEMIVTSHGKNIWPGPLEARLNASPYIVQSLVLGDAQNYLAALIVPDRAALQEVLATLNLRETNPANWRQAPQVLSFFRQQIDLATKDVAEYEKIARFALILEEFSQDREEITALGKLRRSLIGAHYQKDIEELFRTRKPTN